MINHVYFYGCAKNTDLVNSFVIMQCFICRPNAYMVATCLISIRDENILKILAMVPYDLASGAAGSPKQCGAVTSDVREGNHGDVILGSARGTPPLARALGPLRRSTHPGSSD